MWPLSHEEEASLEACLLANHENHPNPQLVHVVHDILK